MKKQNKQKKPDLLKIASLCFPLNVTISNQ